MVRQHVNPLSAFFQQPRPLAPPADLFGDLPLAGAFCNGEVGPVAGATHLHGYTASWAFVVPRDQPDPA